MGEYRKKNGAQEMITFHYSAQLKADNNLNIPNNNNGHHLFKINSEFRAFKILTITI